MNLQKLSALLARMFSTADHPVAAPDVLTVLESVQPAADESKTLSAEDVQRLVSEAVAKLRPDVAATTEPADSDSPEVARLRAELAAEKGRTIAVQAEAYVKGLEGEKRLSAARRAVVGIAVLQALADDAGLKFRAAVDKDGKLTLSEGTPKRFAALQAALDSGPKSPLYATVSADEELETIEPTSRRTVRAEDEKAAEKDAESAAERWKKNSKQSA